MAKKKEAIAELVGLLPMFMGALFEGNNLKTGAKLTVSEEKTLMHLYKDEGSTMTDYSKRVGLARGSFTTVADSLEEKRLVGRVSGSDDRRKYTLVLTNEGKQIAREIDRQFKEHIATKLDCLSEKELGDLKTALEIIAATIEKLNDRRN